ncbi:Hypothetical protein POVR1_LOCUS277 [uncultured virus]|nr:Hypothetical protein POVR1_LOCUS277 [uncultured virus]
MDKPETTLNPFDVPEIFIQLLLRTDRSNYQMLYQSYKALMDSLYCLKQLQEWYRLPIQPKSFIDFVSERDLRDPEKRKELGLSREWTIHYAVKSRDLALIDSLGGLSTIEPKTFYLAGVIGDQKVLEKIIWRQHTDGGSGIMLMFEGLVLKGHNEIFDYCLYHTCLFPQDSTPKSDFDRQKVAKAAAAGGNLYVVKQLYTSTTRDKMLQGAVSGNRSEILHWLFEQSPRTKRDDLQFLYGAIESGNLSLIDEYSPACIMAGIYDIIKSVVESDQPEVLDWLLSSKTVLLRRPTDVNVIYQAAVEKKKLQIISRLLERYDVLSPVDEWLDDEVFRHLKSNPNPKIVRRYQRFLQEAKQLRTVPEIIELIRKQPKADHRVIEKLKEAYDKKWLMAFDMGLRADLFEFVEWIIDRFNPDPEYLKAYSVRCGYESCTAKWIHKFYRKVSSSEPKGHSFAQRPY